jgi:hypothetical protein
LRQQSIVKHLKESPLSSEKFEQMFMITVWFRRYIVLVVHAVLGMGALAIATPWAFAGVIFTLRSFEKTGSGAPICRPNPIDRIANFSASTLESLQAVDTDQLVPKYVGKCLSQTPRKSELYESLAPVLQNPKLSLSFSRTADSDQEPSLDDELNGIRPDVRR